MLLVFRRAVLPALVLLSGLAFLVFGSRFHNLPVLAEEKTEVTIEVPVPMTPDNMAFPGGQDFQAPPQFRKQTVKNTKIITINEFEPMLIHEVTIGGVVLDKSNDLKRTYSGKAPSLCPT